MVIVLIEAHEKMNITRINYNHVSLKLNIYIQFNVRVCELNILIQLYILKSYIDFVTFMSLYSFWRSFVIILYILYINIVTTKLTSKGNLEYLSIKSS